MIDELHSWSATRVARSIERKEVSSEAVCVALLDRIAERDPTILAWATIDREQVLAHARSLDRGPRKGPLHGVPIGIKDVIDTADLPTGYNSPIYRDFRPRADAACVALLKRAGAIVLGKTVTTEFANIHPSQTRNPRNLTHTPGGSSSGSAAAVADFMVPAALGTQTAGSVIRPAAYCGVAAIKPTFGSINRTGVKPLGESLDTIGILARSTEDLALLLGVLSGRSAVDLPPKASGPRIGLCRTAQWDQAEQRNQANIEEAASRLSRAGAQVRDYEMPPGAEKLSDEHGLIMGFESARALAWEYDNFPDKLSPALKARLDAGWAVRRSEYDATLATAADCRRKLNDDLREFDFLIAPSAPGEAPATLEQTGNSLFNRTWTLLGNPCVTIPYGKGEAGLPLGVQLIARTDADMELLAWAGWVRQALGVPD